MDTIKSIGSIINSKGSTVTIEGDKVVSAGLNYGQMNSKGTLYNNAQIQAGNKLIVKADDMTVRGGRLEGKYVDVDVKKNLLIESLQDSEKMKQVGVNLGYSLKKNKTQDGSLGLSLGGKDKKWVKEQSGIIGTENTKVSVGDTTKLIGSIIGGKNTTLRTGKLEYSDIYDKDKGYDIGLNSKVTVSKNEDEWNISKTIGANFGAKDKEQINRATIGSGTIIVGGKVVNPNINRDESIAQEITKNVNVDGISVEYKDNRRRWSDISDIMGEYGKSLGSDLDDLTGRKYNLENKLGQEIYNIYKKIENFVDYKLGNMVVGIIPTEAEMRRIGRGETVERVGIFNPTNGILVDGLIESPIGLLGNKLGLNWAGNDVKKMFIEKPELMRNFKAHSQGSIRYKAEINSLYKTDKGKELMVYNFRKF